MRSELNCGSRALSREDVLGKIIGCLMSDVKLCDCIIVSQFLSHPSPDFSPSTEMIFRKTWMHSLLIKNLSHPFTNSHQVEILFVICPSERQLDALVSRKVDPGRNEKLTFCLGNNFAAVQVCRCALCTQKDVQERFYNNCTHCALYCTWKERFDNNCAD